jgi:hypothetical protein
MRKVTEKTVAVFLQNDTVTMSSGNTVVSVIESGNGKIEKCLLLHGNAIAYNTFKKFKNGKTSKSKIELSNRGWESTTTKERLNGVIQLAKGHEDKIYQKQGVWYWKDGKEFPFNKLVTL